jgi:hypothetical protein
MTRAKPLSTNPRCVVASAAGGCHALIDGGVCMPDDRVAHIDRHVFRVRFPRARESNSFHFSIPSTPSESTA